MKNILKSLLRRGNDESGATAIEYVLIIAIVAVGVIAAFQSVRGNITAKLSGVGSSITAST